MSSDVPLRRRHPIAAQANRILARHLMLRAHAAELPAPDAELASALAFERQLPAMFDDATRAIEAGSWGAPLEHLMEACGCEPLDLEILGLLIAPEIDPELRAVYRRAVGESRRGLDLDVLRALLDPLAAHGGALLDALDIDAPLRRYALIYAELGADGRRTIIAAPRLVRHALDFPAPSVDEQLRHGVRLVPVEPGARTSPLVAEQAVAMQRAGVLQHWLLLGPSGVGQEELARAVAAQLGASLLVADAATLLEGRDPATVARLVFREARLCGAVPLLVNADAMFPDDGAAGPLASLLARLEREPGPVLYATVRRPRHFVQWLRDRREPEPIVVAYPTEAQRTELWRQAAPDAAPADLEFVGSAYVLSPAAIERAAHAADQHASAAGRAAPAHIDLVTACREETTHRLDELASRVNVKIGWSEVVLPDETKSVLDEIIETGKNRRLVHDTWGFRRHLPGGGGLSVLFSGEPGTGKTMVAGLVAHDLGAELYRIDLSRIVSKYIGETEKQLAAIFDEATVARVALLFDEADSMFAKRTEVKNSVDRYANLEVNFLLQKMEEFDGLAILTTNFKQSIDEAFLRRLRFRVHFPKPEEGERIALWRTLIPPTAQVAPDIDFARVAQRFDFSGGHIRNAVVRAAFIAASEGSPIRQDHLERGAKREYEELGRITRD
jgi:AAA+ superfamily predicted ATPase